MTPEQLAAQFEKYATEGFDAPAGSVAARIADAWSCAARLVRTSLVPTGDPVRALVAECDRLQMQAASLTFQNGELAGQVEKERRAIDAVNASLSVVRDERNGLRDVVFNRDKTIAMLRKDSDAQAERIAGRDETIKQLRYSLKLAETSNGALRGMVDTLTAENRTLKSNQCPSWALDAKLVSDALRNMRGE